ncbi:hypothetical protein AZE42_10754 [Rhizopogon vesiculosus]|uniref:DUF5648 domain-containing protein n=1 Tax=Rhizopogon vesiculosus TaxID=180088 RepID=A0A1J8Q1A8_9AGAM|nr:hypothetical protein AZE42_10754 [Rhizopogon vesiculosus]
MMNASVFLSLLLARVAFVKASSADVEELEVCQNIGPFKYYIEMAKATSDSGYLSEVFQGIIFPTQVSGSIPLYRLYNPTIVDHLYTTSTAQKESAAAQDGYRHEGIAGHVYESDVCDSVPLYHLYSYAGTDNFYTIDEEEAISAAAHDGYTMVGNAGWVIPTYESQIVTVMETASWTLPTYESQTVTIPMSSTSEVASICIQCD